MINEEKYKTLNERQKAFQEYCCRLSCLSCKYYKYRDCALAWLADEVADEAEVVKSVGEVIAEFTIKHNFHVIEKSCMSCVHAEYDLQYNVGTLECRNPDLVGQYPDGSIRHCPINDVKGCVCDTFKAKGTDK